MDLHRTFVLSQNQLDAITRWPGSCFAVGVGLVVHRVVYWLFERWSAAPRQRVRDRRRPPDAPLVALHPAAAGGAGGVPNLDVPADVDQVDRPPDRDRDDRRRSRGAIIATIRLWGDVTIARHRIDVEDNLLARQLGTRVEIFSRVGDQHRRAGRARARS